MELETIDIKTGTTTMESGRKTTDMVRGLCSTTTGLSTKEDGRRASSKARASSILATETPMMGSGFAGKCTGEEC